MNLYARLASLAWYQPTNIAIETSSAQISYAGLDRLVLQAARRLREVGVAPGDVVGIRLRETPEHMAAMFASIRLGAIILPLDWRGTRKEFDRVVERFPPRAVVVDDERALDWSPATVHAAAFADAEPDDGPLAAVTDAPCVYSLTSGTTGEPKAMIVTHEQLLARFCNRAVAGMFAPDDRFLNTLALAFTAGREHSLCAILAGATLSLFPILFEPRELVAYVNGHGITTLNLSPNMTRAVVATAAGRDALLMPNLRALISTTGKLQPEERAAIRRLVAPRLIDYYGATAVGTIAVLDDPSADQDPTVAGLPAVGIEVRITTDSGEEASPGGVGRIAIRGPAVASAAPGSAESEDEGYRDGWFYPGDIGLLDARGMLHIHGRAADLIKRGGLMVHAQEVEQALRRHASVTDAAVVGAPSPDLGQEVVAFVVAVEPPVDDRELVRHCRSELAPYKIPSRFVFVDTLPRNANGKVVKAELLTAL